MGRLVRSPCALALVAALLVCACNKRSTVELTDGTELIGEVSGHDVARATIQLTGEQQVTEIPIARVRDIDHPGNGLAVTGSSIGGFGAILVLAGAFAYFNNDDFAAVPLAMGGLFLAAGAPMAIYGFIVWNDSKKHERAVREAPVPAAAGVGMRF